MPSARAVFRIERAIEVRAFEKNILSLPVKFPSPAAHDAGKSDSCVRHPRSRESKDSVAVRRHPASSSFRRDPRAGR